MGSNLLFGEYLGQFVKLSEHDVSEILEHQESTRRRFGEIALSWGLCRPQHIWQAWWAQLSQETQTVDLVKIGVDAQSIAHVPARLATEYGALPLRHFQDELVVATSAEGLARAQAELPALLKKKIQFVIAQSEQIGTAMAAYYPSTARTAAAA